MTEERSDEPEARTTAVPVQICTEELIQAAREDAEAILGVFQTDEEAGIEEVKRRMTDILSKLPDVSGPEDQFHEEEIIELMRALHKLFHTFEHLSNLLLSGQSMQSIAVRMAVEIALTTIKQAEELAVGAYISQKFSYGFTQRFPGNEEDSAQETSWYF